ncbi:MAG: choice-of-anchor K domain-containing protein [Cyanobacteria bacterium P01_E01_bin.6]
MINPRRTLLFSSGIASVAMMMASPGQALTLAGQASGAWGTPLSNESTPRFTGVDGSSFTWGIPTTAGREANQLVFQGNEFTTETNALFKIGDLTYFNGTILSNTGIQSVPLNFELAFDDAEVRSQVFSINFDILTTPNVGTPDDNADAIIPTALISEQSFSSNGLDYTFNLVGFSQDEGLTTTEEFRVLEEARTTASLFGRIIPVPLSASEDTSRIPEPRAIAGLSILAAVFGMARDSRKNRNISQRNSDTD